MAKIGYIRVSTQEQNTARQELLLESLGVERVYREKISGKDTDRPQLKQMMDYIREGDTVVVESYSRFARNTRDLLELVEQLEKKGVAFVSQKENVNTETAEGRLMFTIFAGLAQFEREQLLQRQAEGIAIAKAQGRYKGRQPIQVNQEAFVREYQAWREGKQTAREPMGKLGLRPNTFYRRVKAYEQEINS